MINFKSIRANVNEALKNPYKGKSEGDLKRKLASFETQLADLIKKSRFRQRPEIEGEIRDMETKVQQVRAALGLREDVNELEEAFSSFAVPIPLQTLDGKKIGGGKTPIVVKARTAREAIQKAAKQLGVDFKFLKTGRVVKEDLEESVTLDEAKKVKVSLELWNGKKMKKSFATQSAAEKFIKKMQDEEDVRGYNMFAEGLEEVTALEAGPTFIDGVKYQKLKKKKGFNKADWEWTPSKQLYKRVNEEVALDEAFKRIPGNMINGELPRAAKDLESVIRGLKAGNDFDDKAFNKVLADLNNVKKSAKSFKSEDDVTRPYQYRADPRYKFNEEVTLEEAFNIEKGALVKMKAGSDKDLYGKVIKQIKVNGKPGVTVQWKNGVKGNFRMDQFAAVSMDRKADYQVQDDGVRF